MADRSYLAFLLALVGKRELNQVATQQRLLFVFVFLVLIFFLCLVLFCLLEVFVDVWCVLVRVKYHTIV
jgi:hypothetical protein